MHFRGNYHRKPEMVKYTSNELVVQKRRDYRGNEILKVRKESCHIAPSYGDRFIPRRYDMKEEEKTKKFYNGQQEGITDILKWSPPCNYWLQNNIESSLNKCFDIKNNCVLKFSDKTVRFPNKNDDILHPHLNENEPKKDWSCNPRKKLFIYSETTTHDSVGYSNCFERNMMDWSINGQVVSSFENDVIIWNYIRDMSFLYCHVESISCLAYCPEGKYLALGCKINDYPAIELWDVNKHSIEIEVVERVFFKTSKWQIQCVEWSKCGRFLVCGTSKGVLCVFSVPKLKRVRVAQAHHFSISTMRFSPKMRFLASADIAGNIVVYDWFTFNVYLNVSCKRKTDITLDWHPWNGVELAIAEHMPAAVTILNVPSKQIIAYYGRKDKSVCIHSLTFNKITAELLLCISKERSNGILELKILVLASLDRIVDVLTMENSARFLMWDPEGTRMVTAEMDESLTIWSFHPKKERKNMHTTKHDQLTTMLKKEFYSSCDYGSQFRLWSTIK